VKKITAAHFKSLGIDQIWADPLNEAFSRFEINTPQRQACFIGQCSHESAGFKILIENLNYSSDSLMRVWPSRFKTTTFAQTYHRRPERIANYVYADRMGNGNEASGDGWKYRGRGLIQLTGKDNYRAAGKALGVDFIASPDLVCDPKYAALVAAWYWNERKLNSPADKLDHLSITKKINGGTHGLDDRVKRTLAALSILA